MDAVTPSIARICARHQPLAATWQPGQYWETLVEGATIWVPVSECGYACPLWDERQEYRHVPERDHF